MEAMRGSAAAASAAAIRVSPPTAAADAANRLAPGSPSFDRPCVRACVRPDGRARRLLRAPLVNAAPLSRPVCNGEICSNLSEQVTRILTTGGERCNCVLDVWSGFQHQDQGRAQTCVCACVGCVMGGAAAHSNQFSHSPPVPVRPTAAPGTRRRILGKGQTDRHGQPARGQCRGTARGSVIPRQSPC